MKLYRLRKIGTMTYYNGSSYGREQTTRAPGRLYRRKCDLTNSTRLVQGFKRYEWELQTFILPQPKAVPYDQDGKPPGLDMA